MSLGDLNTHRTEAANGTFVVNDTNAHILNFNTIQITASTVILALKIGGVDVTANYISTITNAVSGGVITCPYGTTFSEIQLASGEVILGLK